MKFTNFFYKIHNLKNADTKEKLGIKANRKAFIIPPNTLLTGGQAGRPELGSNPEKASLPNMDSLTQMSRGRQGETARKHNGLLLTETAGPASAGKR